MYKDVFQHEVFKNELDFRLFALILGNAVYQDEGVMIDGIHVKKGQWLRSYRKLAKDLEYKEGRAYKQYGLASIKRAIERLEKHGFIKAFSVTQTGTNSGTDSGTLFEVVEFEKYQGFQQPQNNNNGTDSETETGTGSGTKLRNKEKGNKEPLSLEFDGKKNLANDADVEAFVGILSDSNPFERVPKKLLIKYINVIRFRRKTKRIATSVVADLWDEWKKFDEDIVTFALWIHVERYKDKDENYTLGIMRNTDVHEARRQLMILKNKNQSDQQTKPRSYWEDRQRREEDIERKRLAERDRQIAVQKFIEAGLNPMIHGDLLEEWLRKGANPAELPDLYKRVCGE